MSTTTLKNLSLAAAVATTLAIPLESSAAIDAYLKLPDIEGESNHAKHENWIDLLSWSWGLSQDSKGKLCVEDVDIEKYMDSSTPPLIQSIPAGTIFSDATLEVVYPGETSARRLTLMFKDVSVSSLRPGASSGDEQVMEQLSLNFSEVEGVYYKQDETGSVVDEIRFMVPYEACKDSN